MNENTKTEVARERPALLPHDQWSVVDHDEHGRPIFRYAPTGDLFRLMPYDSGAEQQ